MAANPQYDDPHGIPMTEEAFERLISAENPYQKLEARALLSRSGSKA